MDLFLTFVGLHFSWLKSDESREYRNRVKLKYYSLTKRIKIYYAYWNCKQRFVSFKKDMPHMNLFEHTSEYLDYRSIATNSNVCQWNLKMRPFAIVIFLFHQDKDSTVSILITHKLVEECRYRLLSV